MSEEKALVVADALGGEPWQSGGDIWLVLFRKPNGGVVVVSEEAVCEYQDETAFEEQRPKASILLV